VEPAFEFAAGHPSAEQIAAVVTVLSARARAGDVARAGAIPAAAGTVVPGPGRLAGQRPPALTRPA
jgi:hypothetical protein